MRMRSLAAVTTLTAASLLGIAGTAGAEPASTDVPQPVPQATSMQANIVYDYCFNYKGRGLACWKAYGDHMLARDIYADGYWIKVDWHTNYGRDGKLADGNSKGDGNQQNYNMDEDGYIRFQVEIWDEDHQVEASAWTPYVAIGQ